MLEAFLTLRRTVISRCAAANHHLIALPQYRTAAGWAALGKLDSTSISRTLTENDRGDLWNDIASSANHDTVADMQIQARDLIHIVQGCVGDRNATDKGGLQPRNGCYRPGSTYLKVDVLDNRGGFLCCELVGDCPARLARDRPQTFLLR